MNIGDKVTIKECHSMPALVGKKAHVVDLLDTEYYNGYEVKVALYEPVYIETPIGTMPISGPFPFRSEELELVQIIPDAFNNAFKEKPPEEGKGD